MIELLLGKAKHTHTHTHTHKKNQKNQIKSNFWPNDVCLDNSASIKILFTFFYFSVAFLDFSTVHLFFDLYKALPATLAPIVSLRVLMQSP